jgi:hypothetical protein
LSERFVLTRFLSVDFLVALKADAGRLCRQIAEDWKD